MFIILFIIFIGVVLFISAITAIVQKGIVMKDIQSLVESYKNGEIEPMEARRRAIILKNSLMTQPFKNEAQDYIDLIIIK